jgi:hypothetical protein
MKSHLPLPTHTHTHTQQPDMSNSASSRPITPPQYGPRPQSVQDLISPVPSLVNFLNNNLERIPINQLGAAHRQCIVSLNRMCDEVHHLNPPDLTPTQPQAPQTRAPNAPGQPAPGQEPESTPDLCPDRTKCEIAVRVTRPGCCHIFGSRCLIMWLRKMRIRCPICDALWYKMDDPSSLGAVLMESWPHQMKTTDEKGSIEQEVRDTRG